MALFGAIEIAVSILFQPEAIFVIVVGTLVGMMFGILPGMGQLVALSLLLPITFTMEPGIAFLLLASALGGGNFGGSITSILINTPGTAVNVATIIDGYPMARDGRADEAIGAAAMASALGAIFGILVLIALLPVMMRFMLLFGPVEIFWLGVFAVSIVATVTGKSIVAGLISGGIGFLISFHGFNPVTGDARFTFGTLYLYDGIPLVPALVGLFAFSEMIRLSGEGKIVTTDELVEVGNNKWKGAKSVVVHKGVFFRSAIIGTLIGIIPGVGGTTANYVAYYQTVQTSKNPESFGKGDIRGLIASEASNDAKDGGSFVPTLGLGIPGSAAMAIFIGAFLFHGMTPGPLLFRENLEIVVLIVFALLISNVLTSIVGFSLANHLARLTQIEATLLIPVVTTVALVGSFAIRANPMDMGIAIIFGFLGFLMLKIEMTRVPLVIAFLLGPIIERNLQRSLQLSRGEPSILIESPLSKLLILLIVVSLFTPILRKQIMRVFNL